MPITPTSTKSKGYQALGIDEIARDIETAFDAINQLEQGSGGSDYTETIVNISSAQILSMGTTPIELLPAAGVGKYYDYYGYIEYTHVTTPYVVPNSGSGKYNPIYIGGASYFDGSLINNTFLGFGNKSYSYKFRKEDLTYTTAIDPTPDKINFNVYGEINESVFLTTWWGLDPTGGDGTLRVKIYHKTITFGA
jgi:hypothetical protein